MNKEELIQYLSVCFDAEESIFETNNLIERIREIIASIKQGLHIEEIRYKETPLLRNSRFDEPRPVAEKTPCNSKVEEYEKENTDLHSSITSIRRHIEKVFLTLVFVMIIMGFLIYFQRKTIPINPILLYTLLSVLFVSGGVLTQKKNFRRISDLRKKKGEAKEKLAEANKEASVFNLYQAFNEQNYQDSVDVYQIMKEKNVEKVEHANSTMLVGVDKLIQKQMAVDLMVIHSLEMVIIEQEKNEAKLKSELEELYSKGIVYPEFQNATAVFQLKEYLKMGVADKLEGSDGAYKVYLEDLRTNKIIDSIESVKRSIETGMTALLIGQGALYSAVSLMNSNLNSLSSTLSRDIKSISDSIVNMKTGIADVIRTESEITRNSFTNTTYNAVNRYYDLETESRKELLKHLDGYEAINSKLLTTIEKSAYNQYLVQKKENLGNYLYSSLKDPR